jgi:2,4-dienoyl-CoA reductase-like NADH-dependent reductase (Old Yellow Enzyme family)
MNKLLAPLTIRGLELKNRLVLSPMCQYSAIDGKPTAWHTAHYTARAQGGVGLVMLESTAVSAQARISTGCLGLWSEDHVAAYARLVDDLHALGCAAGVQLNHAGRKASYTAPWHGNAPLAPEDGGWLRDAPSAMGPYVDEIPVQQITAEQIAVIVSDFQQAARYAVAAGFDVIELHAAHGYLLHQFLSPLSNTRDDAYGKDFEGRVRLTLEVVEAVRAVIPESFPLFVRLSCVDIRESVEGYADGLLLEESIALTKRLRHAGVDLVDCTSGGISAAPQSRVGAFNAGLSQAVKTQADIHTATVGGVDSVTLAESLLADGQCDLVFVGRALLKDPYWLVRQAVELGQDCVPKQYARAGF